MYDRKWKGEEESWKCIFVQSSILFCISALMSFKKKQKKQNK